MALPPVGVRSIMPLSLEKSLDVPVVGIHVIDERILEEGFLEDIAGVLGFNYYAGISGKAQRVL
jgi:hypothetical protein